MKTGKTPLTIQIGGHNLDHGGVSRWRASRLREILGINSDVSHTSYVSIAIKARDLICSFLRPFRGSKTKQHLHMITIRDLGLGGGPTVVKTLSTAMEVGLECPHPEVIFELFHVVAESPGQFDARGKEIPKRFILMHQPLPEPGSSTGFRFLAISRSSGVTKEALSSSMLVTVNGKMGATPFTPNDILVFAGPAGPLDFREQALKPRRNTKRWGIARFFKFFLS